MPHPYLWLPDVLEAAGLKVSLDPGWETRGSPNVLPTMGVICHHTATVGGGVMPTLKLLREGRPDLSGPLCQLALGRDGHYCVVAAGRANHAGGGTWNGITTGNSSFIGIEAENAGDGKEVWPDVQLDAYYRGVAAILSHLKLEAASCCAHKEYATPKGRKADVRMDMDEFRKKVSAIIHGEAPAPVLIPAQEPSGKERPTLRRGATGADVEAMQRKLEVSPVNGIFGPKTEAAVREFQRTHSMVPDGIIGPKSWAMIDALP